ncbi:MAG: DUF5320 family protein [Desulfoprunum sp.]|nr:DUF5320 family protein [Desulfoprunum sp.]
MAGMNQKGPEGAGPLIGGGQGVCRKTDETAGFGQGQGRGLGRGQRSGGRGRCLVSGNIGSAPNAENSALRQQIETNQKTLDALVTKVEQLAAGIDREK